MFQRVMIAALVVIVLGMAASTYFSWQASRDTAQQFTEMNKQLGSLVQMQEADRAAKEPAPRPRTPSNVNTHKILCVLDEAGTPAANYVVEVVQRGPARRGQAPFRETYTTNAEGWITTGPIPQQTYHVSGKQNPIDAPGDPRPGTWGYRIPSGKPETTVETRIVIRSQLQHQVRLNLPAQLSWTEEQKEGLKIRFERRENSKEAHIPSSYTSRIYDITLGTTNTIEGLFPGPATAYLMLPGVQFVNAKDRENPIGAWYGIADVDVTNETGRLIDIAIKIEPEPAVTGIVYNGSREIPLANTQFEWITTLGYDHPGFVIRCERLRTDDQGRFQAFSAIPSWVTNSFEESDSRVGGTTRRGYSGSKSILDIAAAGNPVAIAMPWHTVDGKPITFTWPVRSEPVKTYRLVDAGRFFEIDLSTLATVRVVVAGQDDLRSQGHTIRDLLEFRWQFSRTGSNRMNHYTWNRKLDTAKENRFDVLLFPGDYYFDVSMPLTEYDKNVPDFEQRGTYTRHYDIKLNPGELKEFQVPVADLEKWKRQNPDFEWHKRTGPPPVTTQPATSQPMANSGGRPRSGQVDP